MHEPMHQSDVHGEVEDRIHDLYATSSELRASREAAAGQDNTGLVTRTRRTMGGAITATGSTGAPVAIAAARNGSGAAPTRFDERASHQTAGS